MNNFPCIIFGNYIFILGKLKLRVLHCLTTSLQETIIWYRNNIAATWRRNKSHVKTETYPRYSLTPFSPRRPTNLTWDLFRIPKSSSVTGSSLSLRPSKDNQLFFQTYRQLTFRSFCSRTSFRTTCRRKARFKSETVEPLWCTCNVKRATH